MYKFLLVFILLGGCTTIDNRPPPADFPTLKTTIHVVPYAEMGAQCNKFSSFLSINFACALWDFTQMTCDIWLTPDSSKWIVDHEQLHCLGHDHIGDSTLRDSWEYFKRSKGNATSN